MSFRSQDSLTADSKWDFQLFRDSNPEAMFGAWCLKVFDNLLPCCKEAIALLRSHDFHFLSHTMPLKWRVSQPPQRQRRSDSLVFWPQSLT